MVVVSAVVEAMPLPVQELSNSHWAIIIGILCQSGTT